MRYFVRQSIKDGICGSLNQYYKSIFSDEVFNVISKDIDINGNLFGILDNYFEFTNKHRTIIEDECDSQFEDYLDINAK